MVFHHPEQAKDSCFDVSLKPKRLNDIKKVCGKIKLFCHRLFFRLLNFLKYNSIIYLNIEKKGKIFIMVKHVILWTLKSEFSDAEKEKIKENIKKELEALSGKIPGLIDIKVNIKGIESSNADLMLDSSFESEEALKNYATHPDHVYVADNFVRPFTATRSCLDYIV